MDGTRFDAWTAALTAGTGTRRTALRLLAVGAPWAVLGALLARLGPGATPAQAARACRALGRACRDGDRCCGGGECKGRTCRCIGREVDCRGTCVDPRFDPAHCGGCNRRCALPKTASHNCVSGQCQVRTCKRGFGNCDGDHATGCETETRSNVDHCGGCLRACPPPRVCRDQGGGTCRCPDDRPNQCGPADDPVCVDFATDGQNCGECGMDCSTNNVSARCVDGQCQFLNCAPGWADCDDDLANGCETSLGGVENCGGCGRRCPACDPGKRRICVGSTYCHCF